MSEAAERIEPRFTWDEYRKWPEDERWEIIEGEAYDMSPAPSTRHQWVVGEMFSLMKAHFQGKACRAFVSPLDVRISDEDVVQPDLLVVCDADQIKPTHVEGPPTLVVEVLSPFTQEHDRVRKTRLYAQAGVREYWIVTPWPSSVEVLVLDGSTYRLQAVFAKDETLVSPTFPDLRVGLADIFNFPLEPHEQPPKVREPPSKYGAG